MSDDIVEVRRRPERLALLGVCVNALLAILKLTAGVLGQSFALVGIAVAVVGGPEYARADDVAALLASGVIVFNGVRLAREPYAELMDRDSPEVARAAAEIALGVPGVLGVEQCGARRSGRGYRVVMHAEVDPGMTVSEAHRITGRIKSAVRGQRPEIDSVLIHIEPHGECV